jgi:hypothetical protein
LAMASSNDASSPSASDPNNLFTVRAYTSDGGEPNGGFTVSSPMNFTLTGTTTTQSSTSSSFNSSTAQWELYYVTENDDNYFNTFSYSGDTFSNDGLAETFVTESSSSYAIMTGTFTTNTIYSFSSSDSAYSYTFTGTLSPAYTYYYNVFGGGSAEAYGIESSVSASGEATLSLSLSPAPVPEPATVSLLGFGMVSLVGYCWWRRKLADNVLRLLP